MNATSTMTRRPVAVTILVLSMLFGLALATLTAAEAQAGKRSSSSSRLCAGADASAGEASAEALEAAAICLVNNERSLRGQRRLRRNWQLSTAARTHSADMVSRRYFEHEAPTGGNVVDRLLGTGYIKRVVTWLVGENIAWGSGGLSTPRHVVQSWMTSPPHRENILDRQYREIGMGVVLDTPVATGQAGATYTNTFGMRKK